MAKQNKTTKTEVNSAVELRAIVTKMDGNEVQDIRENYYDAMAGLVNLRNNLHGNAAFAAELECVQQAIEAMNKLKFGAVL
jgi:hypothetical protein